MYLFTTWVQVPVVMDAMYHTQFIQMMPTKHLCVFYSCWSGDFVCLFMDSIFFKKSEFINDISTCVWSTLCIFCSRRGRCSSCFSTVTTSQVGSLKNCTGIYRHKEDQGHNRHCFIFLAGSSLSSIRIRQESGYQQLEPGSETARDIAGPTSSSVAYD